MRFLKVFTVIIWYFYFRKTVVVGAGYIALEIAGVLAALGSETHMLVRYDQVLRTFDQTLVEAATEAAEKGPIKLHKKTHVCF